MPITLSNDSFQVTVNHNRQRYRKRFKDHHDAKVWEAQAKADLIAGKLPDTGSNNRNRPSLPRTIEDLAWYTYETEWSGTPSDDKSQINVKQVIDALGAKTLIGDVDVAAIDKAKLMWKQKGNANATINRKLSCLSKMLTKAKDMGLISEKPKISKDKEPQARIRWYAEVEKAHMYHMLNDLGHSRMVGIVRVLMETGFRCGELFNLVPADVQNNLLIVGINKSSWPRSVPMTKAVSAVINDELGKMEPDQKTIFGWTTYARFLQVWKQMQLHLGWQDDGQAVPHSCRHTFVTNLVQRGVPIAMVQKLAGHKSVSMTMKYTHLGPQDLEVAIKMLDSDFSGILPKY